MDERDGLAELVRTNGVALRGCDDDYDELMQLVGDARFVLLGEASHGTDEFYRERARITRRLIEEKGFIAVAVEADWPDAYRVNCYARGRGDDENASDALGDFTRFPQWMWRNTVVRDFVQWLRAHNDSLPPGAPETGFYGLDLYSLYRSLDAVVGYLDRVDVQAAQRARERYACLERFSEDSQAYGYAAASGIAESCEHDVVTQLLELQSKAGDYASRDGRVAEDELFYTEQNARLVKNAEEYYRSMFYGNVISWNLRDEHMAETLEHLAEHLGKQATPAKIVVWEHNSHIGDARATQLSEHGELNVGQLARERFGDQVVLVGFTTDHGTVTAASRWGGEGEAVRPALPGSYEALLHEAGRGDFLLMLRGDGVSRASLERRLERAIGVIYLPETERVSHYFFARLAEQFDAVIHLDETTALEPLQPTPRWREARARG